MSKMKIVVSSDNIELSESMKSLTELKLEKFIGHVRKNLQKNSSVRVVLNTAPENNFIVRVEADIVGRGKGENEKFFTEETAFEFESALVAAIDEIDRQYLKFKEINEEIGWKERRDGKVMSEKDLKELSS